MSLEFYEDTHTYVYEEEELPSVSEILRFVRYDLYGASPKNKAALGKAADRGSRVHRACEEIDRKGMTDCDPDIIQYIAAYVKFLSEHEVEWKYIETPCFKLRPIPYAGTLDRYGVVDGKKMLIDIKSTKTITKGNKLLYEAQLNAYGTADYFQTSKTTIDAIPLKIDEMAILQLKDDGTYKLIPVAESDVFWRCLYLHNDLSKIKSKQKRKKVS